MLRKKGQTMKSLGIRELKTHLSEVLRDVQAGETIEVTNRGEVIALVIPARQRRSVDEIRASLAELDRLAAEISAEWPVGVTAQDAVNDVRRDL
jgi:prevent-host-death family protein